MCHYYENENDLGTKEFERLEVKHEIKDVDMSDYTKQRWFDEMLDYLVNVMSMNKEQVKAEFDKRFPELLERDSL
jgi:hypothetical protein